MRKIFYALIVPYLLFALPDLSVHRYDDVEANNKTVVYKIGVKNRGNVKINQNIILEVWFDKDVKVNDIKNYDTSWGFTECTYNTSVLSNIPLIGSLFGSSDILRAGDKIICTKPSGLLSGRQKNIDFNVTYFNGDNLTLYSHVYSTSGDEEERYDNNDLELAVENPYACSSPRPFNARVRYNLHGDLIAIGNSNICSDNADYDGICDTNQTVRNDLYNIIYVNENSSPQIPVQNSQYDIFNTSEANLTLPDGAEVVWAGLYWQGEIWDVKETTQFNKFDKAYKVLFKAPGDSDYQELEADDFNFVFVKTRTPTWLGALYDYKGLNRYEVHYQGFKDVTDIVKNAGSGEYWVANIQATIGKLWYPGVEAGWTLQIIYKDPNAKYRNLNIYDGFVALYSNANVGDDYVNDVNAKYGLNCKTGAENTGVYGREISIDISQFLTPTYETPVSDLTLFLTEADPDTEEVGSYEYLTVTDKNGNEKVVDGPDAWNYEITNKDGSDNLNRIPDYIYPLGVTIKNYHKVGLLDNEQTQTTLTFKTGPDRLMIGVIGFAVDIYQPKVCYDNLKYFDQNGNELSDGAQVTVGSKIKVQFDVKNMDREIASQVYVKTVFDDNQTSYVENSTWVKNVKSDQFVHLIDNQSGDLEVTYDDNTKTWSVGVLGDENKAFLPTISDPQYVATVDFNATVENEGNVTFEFLTKYKFEIGNQEFNYDDILPKCEEFDRTLSAYIPESGTFNVVEPTFSGTYDPVDVTNSINDIYTKVAAKPFDMKVLKLDDSKEHTDRYKGLVKIDIIKEPANENECQSNPALWTDYAVFSNDESVDVTDINISRALKIARFRVVYLTDGNGNIVEDTNNACLDKTNNCVWGLLTQIASSRYGNSCPIGSNLIYCDVPCAVECDYKRNRTQGGGEVPSDECLECIFGAYGESVCSRDNFAIRPDRFIISGPTGKLTSGQNYSYAIQALDYEGNPVKDYNETINFAKASANATVSPLFEYNESKAGCITGDFVPNSPLNFVDGIMNYNGAYSEVGDVNVTIKELSGSEFAAIDANDANNPNGIQITTYQTHYEFIPAHFSIPAGSINYSNGGNGFTYISSDLNMSSKLIFQIIAENYNNQITQNYSKNCYAKDVDVNVSHAAPPISTKLIYKELNQTSPTIQVNTDDVHVKIIKDKFNLGSANGEVYINFEKDYKTPVNPFDFTLNDINATNVDSVVGSNTVNQSAHFIYGRIEIPNVAGYSSVIHNSVKYEYFINNEWVINSAHTSSAYGDINASKSIVPGVLLSTYPISNGYQDVKYVAAKQLPYKTKGDYAISSWLWYHPKALNYQDPSVANLNCLTHPCNKISFLTVAGGWAGVGNDSSWYAPDNNKTAQIKSQADVNASKSQVKHLNW